ncbi:glycoside hydrolase family 18 protein [Photobacterium sp. SDRW27]|uniref:glycoside hydrolase family 18 protein n=1 Tax=Photobacterium obscurum TaxID=2829490 RepID=UPI002243D24F|nr:glycoside hydrolase family 18 protein [Photobacterium obscurum]MCW8331044.1 glycoside hydrolase family 18 protein [Photobacterium obscurum]
MKRTLLAMLASSMLASPAVAEQQVVAGYFADWQYDNEANPYTVKDIPADSLSHVIYAFLSMCGPHTGAGEKVQQQIAEACKDQSPYTAVVVDQEAALEIDFGDVSVDVPYKGHFAQLAELKKQHPDLRILPSFGGWTMSEAFHAMAKDKASIDHFAKTAVALIAKYDFFDGIDLDWEYPGGGGLTTSPWNPDTKLDDEQKAEEREAFSYLVKALRIELNKLAARTDRYYELSSAVGVGPKAAQIDWRSAAPYMDNMFAMTYDYLGGWGTQTGHLTNLHATDRSWWGMGSDVFVQQMIDLGIPAEKLVLGAAYYGRGWEGTQDFDGQFPTASLLSEKGASFGTDNDEPGYFMYWDLSRNYTEKEGYRYGYDKASEAPFLWHPKKQVFISFDDKRSVKAKTEWAKKKGLAGVFTWELSGDKDGELTEVIYQTLKN